MCSQAHSSQVRETLHGATPAKVLTLGPHHCSSICIVCVRSLLPGFLASQLAGTVVLYVRGGGKVAKDSIPTALL